ncbi:AraC family transcriptional regulator [Nocardia sp.]|uniref:AraC family transcriptional regulator n=1 Tax=Nocardia sp. TaxID=1821 RepID=UPI002604C4E5|nr:AraC family transcriptional regulator [Nocardia sp.]
MSSHIARSLLDAATQAGVTGYEVTSIDGLRRDLLDDDRLRVPTVALHRLWELLHAAEGPDAGVRAAATSERGQLHVWDYLIVGATTLADGFTDAARFAIAMTDPAVTFTAAEDGTRLTVGYQGIPYDEGVDGVINEYALTVMLRRAREARGAAADPVRVEFSHSPPKNHGYLTEAFGTSNIHFRQPHNSFTMLDPERAQQGRSHDPELRRIMHLYAQSIIDTARPLPTWTEMFHGAIRETLADSQSRAICIEEVARRLSVSTRTLQRRLADQGTSWREELEVVRYQHAKSLLRDTQLPLQSIAGRLGYSDHRTLRRAFQRWTGQSPNDYRRTA